MNTTNNLENKDEPELHRSDRGKYLYKKYLEENSHTPKSFFITPNQQPENWDKDQAIKDILEHLPANSPAETKKINEISTIEKPYNTHSSKIDEIYEIDSSDRKKLFTAAFVVGTVKALRLYHGIFKSIYESLPDFKEIIEDSIQNGYSENNIEKTKYTLATIGKKIQYSFTKNYKAQIEFLIRTGIHLLNIEKGLDEFYDKQFSHIPLKQDDNIENENQKYYQ